MARERGRGSRPGRGRGRGRGRSHAGRFQTADDRSSWRPDLNGETSQELNADLPERFRGQRRPYRGSDQSSNNSFSNFVANEDIRKYCTKQDQININHTNAAWARKTEFPSNDEIALGANDEQELRANKVKGGWKKKDRYLETHYELLREDALHPLREAVAKVRKDPDMMDDVKVSIYEKLHFISVTFSELGLAIRAQFSTRRANAKIKWSSSRRLKSGTIVALTPADDKFQTKCIIAVVGSRPLSLLESRTIDGEVSSAFAPAIELFFSRPEDIQIDPQQEWLMVESKTGYYEGSRHTLKALQMLSIEPFPLQSHIYGLDQDISPPQYLAQRPLMDLGPAMIQDAQYDYENVDVLNEWPGAAQSSLDESQWDALRQILTNRLAVVQGPPGTGKTFVSKIALEIINRYVSDDDPPIIIAAQTNHALDQLLGHVATFQPEYVRLGGQSTNPDIRQRALYELRKVERIPMVRNGKLGSARSTWRKLSKEMLATLGPLTQLQASASNTGDGDIGQLPDEILNPPFTAQIFRDWEVINQRQYESLGAGAAGWLTSGGVPKGELELWLEDRLSRFYVDRDPDNSRFEEDLEDLEFEQLREQEAETGVNDEEDMELLNGNWCSISDDWVFESATESDLEEAENLLMTVQDLWKTRSTMRGPIYAVMQRRLKQKVAEKFRQQAEQYYRILKDLQIGRWERDAIYLSRAKIVGMTTTGLSKYRALVSSLKPKIILIEEAAEVLEGPLTVACMETVEHLILVGDHQQLQGHCNDRELESRFFLNVSMFERLVKNNMPYRSLLCQRRMEPEFRRLISGLYPALTDHASVQSRGPLEWGMGPVKSFFLTHEWHEYRDAQQSTYNEEEARFIAGFYRYLYMNGIPTSHITVLTFYNGQRKKILKYLRAYPELREQYNKVKTVDSYQGEENTIILLSLTRSNDRGQIGFLEVDNRVCVALSRAQYGLYMFGNSSLLANKSRLWQSVVSRMQQTSALGKQLPVYCDKHRIQTKVQYPDEWANFAGGCTKPCGEKLNCGHECTLSCHPFSHDQVNCVKGCSRKLACGHTCPKKCYEECRCMCEEFAVAEQKEWNGEIVSVPSSRGRGMASQDVRLEGYGEMVEGNPYANSKFVSGQHAYSKPRCRSIYLPQQGKDRPFPPPTEDMRANLGRLLEIKTGGRSLSTGGEGKVGDGLETKRGIPWQDNRPVTSSGDVWSIADQPKEKAKPQGFGVPRLTTEEQTASRESWRAFGRGGYKEADEKLKWERAVEERKNLAKEWPALADMVGKTNDVGEGEVKVQDIGGGRKKFTTEYSPSVNRARAMGLNVTVGGSPTPKPGARASGSSVSQVIRHQEDSEQKAEEDLIVFSSFED